MATITIPSERILEVVYGYFVPRGLTFGRLIQRSGSKIREFLAEDFSRERMMVAIVLTAKRESADKNCIHNYSEVLAILMPLGISCVLFTDKTYIVEFTSKDAAAEFALRYL